MTGTTGRIGRTGTRRAGRTTAALAATVVGVSGLAACSDDSAGPEAGGVTAEDLQQLEDRLTVLEDRVGVLEDGLESGDDAPTAGGDDSASDDDTAFFDDAASYLGQEVTVSGEVAEMVTTDVGSALRIAGGSGDPVAVVSAMPSSALDADDVVRVTGTVVEVQRDTFESDFGIAADELFEDADAWFDEEEGSLAISAERLQILQAQGQDD